MSVIIVLCVFRTTVQLYFSTNFLAELSKSARTASRLIPKSLAASSGCGVIIVSSGSLMSVSARIFRPSASITIGEDVCFITFLNNVLFLLKSKIMFYKIYDSSSK